MSFAAKIKPHKVLPAIRTLRSLYSSSLLSLSGFLIAFTFPHTPLEVSWTSFWIPGDMLGHQPLSALRTNHLPPPWLWGVLALTSTAQDQVLARAIRELNKTFKIWSWVSAWTGNPGSRTGKTWKYYGRERSPFLKTCLHPVKVKSTVGLEQSEQSS